MSRQVPLPGRYIADFFAPAAGLVVEVDGGSHIQLTELQWGRRVNAAESLSASKTTSAEVSRFNGAAA